MIFLQSPNLTMNANMMMTLIVMAIKNFEMMDQLMVLLVLTQMSHLTQNYINVKIIFDYFNHDN